MDPSLKLVPKPATGLINAFEDAGKALQSVKDPPKRDEQGKGVLLCHRVKYFMKLVNVALITITIEFTLKNRMCLITTKYNVLEN